MHVVVFGFITYVYLNDAKWHKCAEMNDLPVFAFSQAASIAAL